MRNVIENVTANGSASLSKLPTPRIQDSIAKIRGMKVQPSGIHVEETPLKALERKIDNFLDMNSQLFIDNEECFRGIVDNDVEGREDGIIKAIIKDRFLELDSQKERNKRRETNLNSRLKVRQSEERSDKLTTPSLVTKITRTRTSVQEVPPS